MKYSLYDFVMEYFIDHFFEDATTYNSIETFSKTIIDKNSFVLVTRNLLQRNETLTHTNQFNSMNDIERKSFRLENILKMFIFLSNIPYDWLLHTRLYNTVKSKINMVETETEITLNKSQFQIIRQLYHRMELNTTCRALTRKNTKCCHIVSNNKKICIHHIKYFTNKIKYIKLSLQHYNIPIDIEQLVINTYFNIEIL